MIPGNNIQSSELDEFIYHEALVHPAMAAFQHFHGRPARRVFAGGGDHSPLVCVLFVSEQQGRENHTSCTWVFVEMVPVRVLSFAHRNTQDKKRKEFSRDRSDNKQTNKTNTSWEDKDGVWNW